jgi:hypothetical protein
MSDSAKRIQASSLRPDRIGITADRQECRGVPPVWCAHAERLRAPVRRSATLAPTVSGVLNREGGPRRFETLLQFKGFGGGVPLNTETAAVKPRVGSAS